jgi:hypothetical protein
MVALSLGLTVPEARTFVRTSYVSDVRPLARRDPPAGLFFYSRNRHLAGYVGIL